ncbi:hypothetical protein [Montanilutibacter psychrotolerans]|nr:hypothetical protein [Lysobacter psychrotolerans]
MKRMLNRMLIRMLMIAALLVSANTLATPPGWSDTSTAAATGYCLAKHPYLSLATGAFTSDGYEVVAPPGVVGAVRRNYMYSRTSTTADEGRFNSCAAACKQFGRQYAPTYSGVPLRQQVRWGTGVTLITSGIGDIGALAMRDRDFYLGHDVVAGFWSRGNTWHESDVAQADYCCCQAR